MWKKWYEVVTRNFFALTHALTPKLCIHCKHFMANREVGIEFGKCRILPKKPIDTNLFVTGKTIYKEYYWYCSTARQYENLCGEKGKQFEKIDTLQ